MSRNKVTVDFGNFRDYLNKLEDLAGEDGLKKGVEAGLKSAKQYVNQELKAKMSKSNLPAHGKYSRSITINSIDKDFNIEWKGSVASTKVGFDFHKSGLTSIFLMYGTPKMPPVPGLYEAVYGRAAKSKIRKLQKEAIQKVIERTMEGN